MAVTDDFVNSAARLQGQTHVAVTDKTNDEGRV